MPQINTYMSINFWDFNPYYGTLTHIICYALGVHNINIDMSKDCPFGTSIHIICYATGVHPYICHAAGMPQINTYMSINFWDFNPYYGTLTHIICYALGVHNINIDMSKDCPFGTSIHIICYATGVHPY